MLQSPGQPRFSCSEVSHSTVQAIFTLKARQRQGIKRPVLHVLMADGRVTEFKDRVIVLPDAANGPNGRDVFAQLVTRDGTPYVNPDGTPILLPVESMRREGQDYVAVPVTTLSIAPNPDKLISWKGVANLAGVSLSTAKRMVAEGKLPKPMKIALRKVGFKQGEVAKALRKVRESKSQ